MPAPALDHSRLNPGRVGAGELTRIAALTQPIKARIRALLELRPGLAVLDVGCGAGQDAVAVAARVAPAGRVVGLDYDVSLVEAARRQPAAVQAAPTFIVADAAAMPYADDVFDRVFSERVLQHCDAPSRVVAEMVRVTRPGGVVVLADADWATLSIDTPEVATERTLVRFVGDALRNGYAGRQLRRLLIGQRCTDVHVEVWPIVWTDYNLFRATSLPVLAMEARAVRAGALTAAALARLDAACVAAERGGQFFASAALMIARGRAPLAADADGQDDRRNHGA